MAERSFTEEVGKLRLGEGETFRGEGILAVTKALLESGVAYVAGYQGAPISHLMDVLTDANDILEELGVHFEHSASEATAAATLAASVHYPLRGAVTFKSTVGTNVASDALANLASGGVTGGALMAGTTYNGVFTAQFVNQTPTQVFQTISTGGTAAASFSATFVASSTVPEPSTYVLLATGIGALGLVARRRRSNV